MAGVWAARHNQSGFSHINPDVIHVHSLLILHRDPKTFRCLGHLGASLEDLTFTY